MKSVPSAVKLAAFILLSTLLPAHAAVRETWVQHFDGGFPNKASQPVAMQLDSQGNIYIVGSTANASNLTDYVTLKYTPNGTLLWSERYGTTNGLNNVPRAIGMDTNDNLYVTGTSVTVKYSFTGDELWTAPYGGRSLLMDGTNLYVTGFSETQIATAALTSEGNTRWLQTRQNDLGRDFSFGVFRGQNQRVMVLGLHTFWPFRGYAYLKAVLVAYDSQGAEIDVITPQVLASRYILAYYSDSFDFISQRFGLAATKSASDRPYLFGEFQAASKECFAINPDRQIDWEFPGQYDDPHRTRLGNITGLVESGQSVWISAEFEKDSHGQDPSYGYYFFGVTQIEPDGRFGWQGDIPGYFRGNPASALPGVAQAICASSQSGPAATGLVYISEGATNANIGTVQYATNGTVLWAQQYNGAANGHDEGKAIVTDSAGSVYVAGLSTTPEGGTEIVLIKYSESATVEQSPTGSILLHFPGTPGQPYKIQASTNLPNWLDIGLGTATTNGLLQFEDTNATKYPFRFYQTVSPTP